MKNSKEIASAVFQARDAYREQQQKKIGRIRKSARISSTACVLCLTLVGVGYWNSMQNRLPSVQTEMPTEETADAETYPTEDATAASTDTQAENPIGSTSVVSDTQTETQAFSTEVQTEMIEETVQIPPATEPIPPITEAQTTEEAVEVPRWDEKTLSEQFMEFTMNGNVYHSKCSSIADEYVGEKLYDVVATGYDDYADEVRYADASAYRINGISEESAVSIRFRGYDTGYVYISWNYYPETLGELMNALNLTETISFHALTPAQGESRTEFDRSLLMDLLNDHREIPRIEDDSYHKPLFSISTSVELLGIRNKSMKITEDGWLTMNIMEVGYSFSIGEDTARELAEAIGINTDISAETTAPYKENTEDLVLE